MEDEKVKSIARTNTCQCFSARKSILAIETICWFCKYANFDLNADKLPEKGTCCYPKEQSLFTEGGKSSEN